MMQERRTSKSASDFASCSGNFAGHQQVAVSEASLGGASAIEAPSKSGKVALKVRVDPARGRKAGIRSMHRRLVVDRAPISSVNRCCWYFHVANCEFDCN